MGARKPLPLAERWAAGDNPRCRTGGVVFVKDPYGSRHVQPYTGPRRGKEVAAAAWRVAHRVVRPQRWALSL